VTAHPRHPWARRAKRIVFAIFLVLVTVLLVRAARAIDWDDVVAVLRGVDAATLASALLLTAASYALYTGYDLAARAYAGHHVSTPKVMTIAFIAYAFALNIGALVGGAGFRLRMYAREDVPLVRITRVIAFAIATNWIGYIALAGGLFASGAFVPGPDTLLGRFGTGTWLRALGVAMLAVTVAYLVACRVTHGRVYHVRGHHFRFPTLHLALLQIAMAATNWSLMAAVVAQFLPRTGDAAVLGALLFAAVASAVVHIPAGIGVLEAVFIAVLGRGTPAPQLIAALLAYRACYYLVPLVLATIAFAVLELGGRRARPRALR
jgi:glycosyltransferase 2 family protein